MAYGAGGYQFVDYLRFGLPLNVATAVTIPAIIPLICRYKAADSRA